MGSHHHRRTALDNCTCWAWCFSNRFRAVRLQQVMRPLCRQDCAVLMTACQVKRRQVHRRQCLTAVALPSGPDVVRVETVVASSVLSPDRALYPRGSSIAFRLIRQQYSSMTRCSCKPALQPAVSWPVSRRHSAACFVCSCMHRSPESGHKLMGKASDPRHGFAWLPQMIKIDSQEGTWRQGGRAVHDAVSIKE